METVITPRSFWSRGHRNATVTGPLVSEIEHACTELEQVALIYITCIWSTLSVLLKLFVEYFIHIGFYIFTHCRNIRIYSHVCYGRNDVNYSMFVCLFVWLCTENSLYWTCRQIHLNTQLNSTCICQQCNTGIKVFISITQ